MNSKETIAKIHALSINAGARCTKAGMSGPSVIARRGYGSVSSSGYGPAEIGGGITNGFGNIAHVQDIHDLAHELSYSSKSTKSGLSAKFSDSSSYQGVHDESLQLGARCHPQPGIALSSAQAQAQSVHDQAALMGAICGEHVSFSADDEPADEVVDTVLRWIRR